MEILIGIPIILFATIMQSSVISHILLLSGTADILLVFIVVWSLNGKVRHAWPMTLMAAILVSFISAQPVYIPFVCFLFATFLARLFHNKIWQTPLLMTFGVILIATLFQHILTILSLQLMGTPTPFGEAFSIITLPSILLNLLWSIPIYWLVNEIINRIYPEGMDE